MALYIFFSMFEFCSFKPLNYILSFPSCFLFSHYVFEFVNTSFLLVNYVLNIPFVFHSYIAFHFRNIIYSSRWRTFIKLNVFGRSPNYVRLMDWVHCSRVSFNLKYGLLHDEKQITSVAQLLLTVVYTNLACVHDAIIKTFKTSCTNIFGAQQSQNQA